MRQEVGLSYTIVQNDMAKMLGQNSKGQKLNMYNILQSLAFSTSHLISDKIL